MFGRKKELSFDNELERALEATAESLENVLCFKEMVRTDGWKTLEALIRKDIHNKLKQSFALQSDPIANAKQLTINYAVCNCWERMLSIVHGTVNKEEEVLAELKRLAGKE